MTKMTLKNDSYRFFFPTAITYRDGWYHLPVLELSAIILYMRLNLVRRYKQAQGLDEAEYLVSNKTAMREFTHINIVLNRMDKRSDVQFWYAWRYPCKSSDDGSSEGTCGARCPRFREAQKAQLRLHDGRLGRWERLNGFNVRSKVFPFGPFTK